MPVPSWYTGGDPSQAAPGSAAYIGMQHGIDPRNYARHDDWANAIAGLSSGGSAPGTWVANPNQVNGRSVGPAPVYGGSSGQYPAAPTSTPYVPPANAGSSPVSWGTTGGNMAPGSAPPGGVGGYSGGGIAPPNASTGYALNPGAYLDPSMAFETAEGLRALGSRAGAAGQTFAGNTLKEIMDYSQGRARTNYNNATAVAQQQQGFGRGVDVNNRDFTQGQNVSDRDFAYLAQLNDQTIPFGQRMAEAQLGLQGAAGGSSLAAILAQLVSGNTMTGGQAGAAGTVGGNNAITQMISQLLAQMNSGAMLNRIPGLT